MTVWVKQKQMSSYYANTILPDYKLFGNIRLGRIGEGMGILIHNSLRYRQRKDLELSTEIFEHTVKLKTDIKNILLVSGYRPPNTNAKKLLWEYNDAIKFWKKTKNS